MIYIQAIGLLAFCIFVLSFYRKNPVTILIYQTTSNLIYALHYFLLGGITGAVISIISVIRNVLFIKSDKQILLICLLLPMYIIVTIVFYDNIYSLLPMIGNSTYMLFMTFKTKKHLLIGEIISASIWAIYGIFILSYAEMITESILAISCIYQLIKLKRVNN